MASSSLLCVLILIVTFEKLFNSKLIFLSGLFFFQEGFFSLCTSQEDIRMHGKVYRALLFREELWDSLLTCESLPIYALSWFRLVLEGLAPIPVKCSCSLLILSLSLPFPQPVMLPSLSAHCTPQRHIHTSPSTSMFFPH